MVKECTLSAGKLPLGGLPRNRVFRITDHPDMTSAVYRGRITNQIKSQNKNLCIIIMLLLLLEEYMKANFDWCSTYYVTVS